MRRLFILATLFIPFLSKSQDSNPGTVKNSNSNSVQMELLNEINSSSSIGITLNPIILSGQGGVINYCIGGTIGALNLGEKFNVFGEYNLNTGRYDKNDKEYAYKSIDLIDKKASSFELLAGYTFDESKNNKKKSIDLAKIGNTSYVTEINAKEFVSKIARIGFNHQGQFLSGTYIPVGVGQTNYTIFNSVNNIVFGYQNVSSIKSKYKTDKFGVVYAANQESYYLDLLVMMPSDFTYIENKEQNTTANSVLSADLSMEKQNEFRENFRKSPIGFRVGYKSFSTSTKRDFLRYSFGIEAGASSGYFQSTKTLGIASLLNCKVTFGIGFLQMLK